MIIPKPLIENPQAGAFVFPDELPVHLAYGKDHGHCYFVADELSQRLRVATGKFISIRDGQPDDPATPAVVLTDHDAPADLGPEGYQITITPERITLYSKRNAGLFYAGGSLAQVLHHHRSQVTADAGHGSPTLAGLPCVDIKDRPRFPWRGFMLDSARHFQPIELITQLIDRIAALKLNRFHWHLTDDQGWRLEILGYPKLTSVGAWRNNGTQTTRYGGYYTQQQVREVVAYAKMRNVMIVPEIDIPSHNLAALAAYPELSCHGEARDVTGEWGLRDGVYCVGQDATFRFLENVFAEVAALFPDAPIHIGGDERKPGLWDNCPRCLSRRKELGLKDESALQRWMMDKVAGHIRQTHGRRSISWGDIIEYGCGDDIIVQGWVKGQAETSAEQGIDTINSTNQWVYLDYPQSAEEHAASYPDWMATLPVEKVYEFDPIPEGLDPQFHKHILGSEANLWTEFVPDEAQLYHQIMPRLYAFSEVVWSPAEGRSLAEFEKRLAVQRSQIKPQ